MYTHTQANLRIALLSKQSDYLILSMYKGLTVE